MHSTAELFYRIGEPYAAGLFEEPDKGYFYRHCLAHRRYFEALSPAEYAGERLYPTGVRFFQSGCAVTPQFALTYLVNWEALEQKSRQAADILREFYRISHDPGGWTHAAPNYGRILREGLESYRERVLAREPGEFREGLLAVLAGMENYLQRSAAYLHSVQAPDELIRAVSKVPFAPAENIYEGLVAWNLIFYFDGADNLGCLDKGLAHLHRGEDVTDMIGELFGNIDAVGNWSCTIGPEYNDLTRQALVAIRNRRRPLLELMVREDMPQELWDLAIESNRMGSCNPAFYAADNIHHMLKCHFPHIPDGELRMFCGCGCTETNLEGLTRAGGTDETISLLGVFEPYLHAHLAKCPSFETFYEGFCRKTEQEIDAVLDRIIAAYEYRANYLPNPMRTLFTDDCIEKGLDFNGGGARYTWTQSSDAGLINVIDSLLAVKTLVYDKKQFAPEEFLQRLSAEDPALFALLKTCPCYGVDDPVADALGADYARRVYACYRNKKPGNFIDACLLTEHQFNRHEHFGKLVGPTPDGRHAEEPLADSIASLRGKATDGPTAMLASAARLPQNMADGISVLNLTLNKNYVGDPLRGLILGYFRMGGTQVQVTVTSPEELQDAYDHPEKHRDLIVRVGGYADYFVNLSPALRKTVLERNLHQLG